MNAQRGSYGRGTDQNQISNVSAIVRLVEVNPTRYVGHILPRDRAVTTGENLAQLAFELLSEQRVMIAQTKETLERIEHEVLSVRRKRGDERKTRQDKAWGDRRRLILRTNELYACFLKLPRSHQVTRFALDHYLQRELDLDYKTWRRRMNELRERYGFELSLLPWQLPEELDSPSF